MNLFKTIFPLELQLNILQLEEYNPARFIRWNARNFLKRNIQTKKKLVYTPKIKNIILIYFLICLVAFLINLFLFLILILEPFIGLTLAVLFLKPYEIYNRQKTINKTREKILSFKDLKVIGITGSFGKTSTKEILYQILKTKFKVLRTPESFNTVFGIAKVVDLEFDNSYNFFICEMAAYKIGDIKELCKMVPPNFGILTGITTQHFERFGSLENTIKTKFELVNAIKNTGNIIFNLKDENILQELKNRKIKVLQDNLEIKNIKFTKDGSSFDIKIKNKTYKIKTELFGLANIKNLKLAILMAQKIGMSEKEIINAIKNIKPTDNRMVLNNFGKTTIVNNTYSSNIQSFKEMIETAKRIKGRKVLVTPGIVELGKIETNVHIDLGKIINGIFDKVILVGKNNRTKNIAKTLEKNFEFIDDDRKSYFEKIEELKTKYDWIFLENDVTQNY